MTKTLRYYRKGLLAIGGAALSFAVLVLTSPAPGITGPEVASGLIGLGAALGVTGFSNGPKP